MLFINPLDHVVLSSSSSVSLHLSLSPALLANRSVVLEFTALNKRLVLVVIIIVNESLLSIVFSL